ncbi:MAG: MFS transporter [Nanoarchaeota archaeon]|nr:MFS transporter [Nanoarchaeota archaeon]
MTRKSFRPWRKRILFSVWITYASFYLGRVNMSVAIPGIMKEFSISKTEIGLVLTALFTLYAIGQFVNGQLADKFGARKLITTGLLMSAIANAIFGFTGNFLAGMALIWAFNGFFQSMGWSPSVKTIANWFPRKKRGRIAGLLGTSYQIGSAASWALSGFIVGAFGWRWAFWVPAVVLVISAIHFFIRVRNAPEEVGLPTIEEEANGALEKREKRRDEHLGFWFTIKLVLTKKRVWAVALGLFCLNIVRYGFMDWAPTYLFEVQQAHISTAAFKAMIIPIAGSIGAISAGWISDKFFKSRRAPVAAVMLYFLAIFCWFYPKLNVNDWVMGLVFLAVIGFMTYGPHVLMVTTMPMDFGTRKAAASAAGFIDGWGYIGAAITGVGSGFLIDTFGWNAAFYFWVLGALGAAIVMTRIWNYGAIKGNYH